MQATKQAERSALSRLHRLGGAGDQLIDCLHRLVTCDHHFSPATVRAALSMLCELGERGQVVLAPGDTPGMNAAEAILWVMEWIMPGTEVIIGSDRPSPLRTVGDPAASPEDQARAKVLLQRIKKNSPLHLVFCHDGEGTPAQKQAYAKAIHKNAEKTKLMPHEHVLPLSRSAFPHHLSGVLILNGGWTEAGVESEVFAMHTAPTSPTGSSRALVLRWAHGQASVSSLSSETPATRMVASDVADPGFKRALALWASFLSSNGMQDLSAKLVRD